MREIHAQARMLMKGLCRVCDGRVCADEVPSMGGLVGTASADKVVPEILRH